MRRGFSRWWWLTQQALAEARHLKLVWIMLIATLALVAGASMLREFNFGAEEPRFIRDFAEGALALFGTVLAIALSAVLVQGGLATDGIGFVLVRGVRRHEWLLSRWLAVCVSLGWLVLAGYLLLGALLGFHGHPISVELLVRNAGLMFLRLALVAEFALLCSVAARGFPLAVVLSLALSLAAQLAPMIEWAQRHGGNSGRWLWTSLAWLVPSFEAFESGNEFGHAIAYAGGYAIIYLGVSCLIFSQREL
jgi:ABC-type transport system involved in multi-copper enzyme maturation permease subunit